MKNTPIESIPEPKFRYVKIDETAFWSADFLKRLPEGSKMIATYIYDANAPVHCAELTPSYWLEFAGVDWVPANYSYTMHDAERESIDTAIMESVDDCSHYMHCSDVNAMKTYPIPCDAEVMDDVLEYFQANPSSFDERKDES